MIDNVLIVAPFIVGANVIPARGAKLAVQCLIIVASYHNRADIGERIDDGRFHAIKILELVNKDELIWGCDALDIALHAVHTVVVVNRVIVIGAFKIEIILILGAAYIRLRIRSTNFGAGLPSSHSQSCLIRETRPG
jgi:hypothetical protein